MRDGHAETTSRVAPPPLARETARSLDGDGSKVWRRSRRSRGIVGLIVLLVGMIVFVAGRAYVRGRSRADDLVGQLHTQMNQKDWDGIYGDADAVYQAEMTSADSQALFAAIDRKLGQVNRTSQQTTNIAVNNSGSYLTAQFATQFAGDEHATETIVWRSLGGAYHLHSYTIRSLPLLTK